MIWLMTFWIISKVFSAIRFSLLCSRPAVSTSTGSSPRAFADAIGITPANVAVLKNGRAKAVRFTTLDAICRVLECQPGDLLQWVPDEAS